MHFSEYQSVANKTDQVPLAADSDLKEIMIPLLGLAGESGSLLTEYKKYFRDGDAYKVFHGRVGEELGDILWYVANIASKAGLDLEDIASKNLHKVQDRWITHAAAQALFGPAFFDDGFPTEDQFPRQFEIELRTEQGGDGRERVQLYYNDRRFGDELTDNSYDDDGYRLHDVFHLGFLAVLGWSPVMRKLFNCKRKSDPIVDEVQDGGRAAVIDEAIVALIFTEGKTHSFFEGIESLEYGLLRTIKDLTTHLEVSACTARQWEDAILQGFKVWRELRKHKSGRIHGDLMQKKLIFVADEDGA